MKRFSLSGFQLKYIALITMVFDHIQYFFEYTGKIPIWFTMIGRLAAPLFLFAVIEGFVHTHNRKKYFLRIYALAILMGLIQFGFYNFLHPLVRPDGFFPQNMMLSSFAILLVALQGIAWIQEKKYLKGILTLLFPILEVLAFVSVSLVWVLMAIVVGRLSIHDLMFKYIEWMEIFAAPLMLCYNGQRGKGSKYLFYVFYPTHIYLLYALSVIFYR